MKAKWVENIFVGALLLFHSKEHSIQKSPFIVMSVHKNESEFECGLIRKQYFQIYILLTMKSTIP